MDSKDCSSGTGTGVKLRRASQTGVETRKPILVRQGHCNGRRPVRTEILATDSFAIFVDAVTIVEDERREMKWVVTAASRRNWAQFKSENRTDILTKRGPLFFPFPVQTSSRGHVALAINVH